MLLRLKYIIQGFVYYILSLFIRLKNHSLYNERLDICNLCDYNKNGICSLCGCFVKAKTHSDSHCKVNKW